MFSHIILFKFNADISQEHAMGLLARLGSLIQIIPQIFAYRYGVNDAGNPHSCGFTHAFVMDFLSKEERYIYQRHPKHLDFIATFLNPVITDAVVFDMENHYISVEKPNAI
jgi:hypothetical protein